MKKIQLLYLAMAIISIVVAIAKLFLGGDAYGDSTFALIFIMMAHLYRIEEKLSDSE